MAVTNTPDKSEMKAVTIPGELYAFLMGEGEIDGTSFGDLNANLPGRFWWRALLRTAASSRPPADQVPARPAPYLDEQGNLRAPEGYGFVTNGEGVDMVPLVSIRMGTVALESTP